MAKAPQAPARPAETGMSEAETRLARYRQVEREADKFGRLIGIRRLRPSEQGKVQGFTPELTGFDEAEGEDGIKRQISHRAPYFLVAAVCEIDGHPVSFPRNRGELDAVFDRLDREGIAAAASAAAKLYADDELAGDGIERAKNLPGIPSSA